MFRYALLAQADNASKNSDSNGGANSGDKPGQVDVSLDTAWVTIDNMVDAVVARLPHMAIALVIFVVFYIIAKIVRSVIRNTTAERQSANVGKVMGRISQWVIIFLGLMIAVAVVAPTVTPGRVLATLGVGGVAIGFAFKDILQNFMAGLLILLREPFQVGDQIVSGDHEGTVESIETRATMIKTYNGRRVVIPNSQIYTNPVVVNTAYDTQRSQYDVGIGYGDDLREAAKVILKAVKASPGVLEDPAPEVLVVELAGSTVNLRPRWWCKSDRASVVNTSHEVIANIKEALDEANIDMPYPTSVQLFHDQTESTDGDRTRQREGWPAGDNPPESARLSHAVKQVASPDNRNNG